MSSVYNLKKGVTDWEDIANTVEISSGDGAIPIKSHVHLITKGSAAALTLGTPTTAQNGTIIYIVSTTAQTHTVTCATIGFNAGNADTDVGTFGGAIGDGFTVVAYGGEWYVMSNIDVTLA
jgi:hypothetical protein